VHIHTFQFETFWAAIRLDAPLEESTVGRGETTAEAIDDLLDRLQDRAETVQ